MVNASSVFQQLVFRIVQATVQQRTLSKIGIFGSDSELWPAEVRSKLRKYGAKVNRGGQVPRSLHLVNGEREHKEFMCFNFISPFLERRQKVCDRTREMFRLKVQ